MDTGTMNKTINQELAELYFRFKLLVSSVKGLSIAQGLIPETEGLLDQIGRAYQQGETVTVLKLCNMTELGAPATVHKRLQLLKQTGFIDVTVSDSDARIKYVTPTARACDYFAAGGQAVQEFRTR